MKVMYRPSIARQDSKTEQSDTVTRHIEGVTECTVSRAMCCMCPGHLCTKMHHKMHRKHGKDSKQAAACTPHWVAQTNYPPTKVSKEHHAMQSKPAAMFDADSHA